MAIYCLKLKKKSKNIFSIFVLNINEAYIFAARMAMLHTHISLTEWQIAKQSLAASTLLVANRSHNLKFNNTHTSSISTHTNSISTHTSCISANGATGGTNKTCISTHTSAVGTDIINVKSTKNCN